jgi:hypothetical protein
MQRKSYWEVKVRRSTYGKQRDGDLEDYAVAIINPFK